MLLQVQHNGFHVALQQIEDVLSPAASLQGKHASGFLLIAAVWKQGKQTFIGGNTAVHSQAVPHTRNAQGVGKISGIAQQKKGFQKAGLAAVVVADDQIDVVQVRNR